MPKSSTKSSKGAPKKTPKRKVLKQGPKKPRRKVDRIIEHKDMGREFVGATVLWSELSPYKKCQYHIQALRTRSRKFYSIILWGKKGKKGIPFQLRKKVYRRPIDAIEYCTKWRECFTRLFVGGGGELPTMKEVEDYVNDC